MHRTILLGAGAFLALFSLVLLGNTQTNHTALAGAVFDVEFSAIDLDPAGNTGTHIGPDATAQATNGIDPGDIQSVLENVLLNTPVTIDIVVDGLNFYDPTNSEDSPACNGAVNDDSADDALVNDGCPASGAAESGTNCANATNDDPTATDTFVNDGCPQSGSISEANIAVPNTCSDGIENAGGDIIVKDDQDTDCYDSGPSGGIGLYGVGFELLYNSSFVKITANNTTATNAFLQFSQAPASPLANTSDIDINPGDDTDGSFRLDSVGGGPQESGPGRVAQIVFECTAVGHSTLALADVNTGGNSTIGVLYSSPAGGTYIVGTEIDADVYCGMSATPTNSPSPTPTNSPSPTPTNTPSPTPTGTGPTPTNTPSPTPTGTGPTPTATPVPTGPTPTATPVPTGPTPTATPVGTGPTPTATPVPTGPTPTPTATPTGTPSGITRVWGDSDCDTDITTRDNQALLRRVLSQPALSQTEPCPDLGTTVTIDGVARIWGDWDCDGEITTRDNQALLRNVLSQAALSQTEPCPDLGDSVQASA